jgi:4-amino-4-deoxy-L-arabinose transferase-like glycosyltransferase
MTKSLKLGIAFIFLFQLLIAANFGLSHDEAYYWLFSRHLSFGYFDHPPFVAAVISLFSFLPHHEVSVRLGFILLQAGTLFFLFKLVPRENWKVAFLLFFSFPLASNSGLLALPDMPLLFMTSVYFYFLKGYLAGERSSTWALGVAIPLLLYAKYHGILLIFFTILAVPRILLRRDFWLVTFMSVIFFLPHVWWQNEFDYPTLRYHFLERPGSSFSIKRILDYVGTQIVLSGLLCGPILWWKLSQKKAENSFERVLICTSWGIFFFFLVSTFSKKVEANWTISLVIPMVILLSGSEIWFRKWARVLLSISFSIVVLARIIFVVPSLPIKRLAEFHGWEEWSQGVSRQCGGRKILANSYQIASKLSFYLNQEVSAFNYRSRKNQFDFWPRNILGEICYVTDKAEFQGTKTVTPEKKVLKIVTNLSGEELIARKLDDIARKIDKP